MHLRNRTAQVPMQQAPYRWGPVHIVGGGYITGMTFHPAQKELVLAGDPVRTAR